MLELPLRRVETDSQTRYIGIRKNTDKQANIPVPKPHRPALNAGSFCPDSRERLRRHSLFDALAATNS